MSATGGAVAAAARGVVGDSRRGGQECELRAVKDQRKVVRDIFTRIYYLTRYRRLKRTRPDDLQSF